MNIENVTAQDIRDFFKKANPNLVRELSSPLNRLTEDDVNLIRNQLNRSKKQSYEVRYCVNVEEQKAYVHIRRLS